MTQARAVLAALAISLCIILGFGGLFVVDAIQSGRGVALEPFALFNPPEDKHPSLLVTIPELDIRRVPTKYAPADDKAALRHGFMHVKGTGYPWQPHSNVYLAGHDLGFPGTRSWRLLWHLNTLMRGDSVTLEGPGGDRYHYRVYESEIVEPHDTRVLLPQDGKRIVSLQVCVPHWVWSHRLVVRAKFVKHTRRR